MKPTENLDLAGDGPELDKHCRPHLRPTNDSYRVDETYTKGRNLAGRKTALYPYLRVANVQRGFLDLDVMKDIEIPVEELEKYRLQKGDILLTEGGDWDKLGRSAIWEGHCPFPIPPVEEQDRIVAKVNQLTALCDELEAKLTQSQTDSEKWMDAAVRQVLVP